MIKEYVIKYKVFTIPYWYEWKCYVESAEKALLAFHKENPIGIELYRIAFINPIR